jgi:DNA replication and repair protein RecF
MIYSIRLQNYRSYTDNSFEFDPGVNIIVGSNGAGKTSLIEGIYLALRGDSWKSGIENILASGQDWFRIDLATKEFERVIKYQPLSAGLTKLNRDEKNKLPVVLFEPGELDLLSGSPTARRDLLDSLCVLIDPTYHKTLLHYRRALLQRNNLLKQATPKPDFFIWNLRLGELAGRIVAIRQKLVHIINLSLQDDYRFISSKLDSTLDIAYKCSFSDNYSDQLVSYLENSYHRDLSRCFTARGPHREDFDIVINGLAAGPSASRGESRTIQLALKLAEARITEDYSGIKPILLLDDVFSELDNSRRLKLSEKIRTYQSFITTTDAETVIDHFGTVNIMVVETSQNLRQI